MPRKTDDSISAFEYIDFNDIKNVGRRREQALGVFFVFALGFVCTLLQLIPGALAQDTQNSQNRSSQVSLSKAPKILVVEGIRLPLLSRATQEFQNILPLFIDEGATQPEITVVTYEGQGDPLAAGLKQNIETEKPDLIILMSTIAIRAFLDMPEYAHIPVVFTYVTDPVEEGIVEEIGMFSSLNMTGFLTQPNMVTKIDMAKTVLSNRNNPQPLRIGFLISNYPSAQSEARWFGENGLVHGKIEFVPIHFIANWKSYNLEAWSANAISALRLESKDLDGLWMAISPSAHNLPLLKRISTETGLPFLFGPSGPTVEQGATFGLGVTTEVVGRELALRVSQILSGAAPKSMSIDYPKDINVLVNIETMLKMGVVPPSLVLELAGSSIYTQEKL